MELKVIKGFEDVVENVRIIQFEYGIFNIASHDLLHDFHLYLGTRGFLIGKRFPRHVSFRDYHFNHENFYGSNYLAVKEDETELIKTLSDMDSA